MAVVSERDDTERAAVTEDMLKIFLEAFNRHDLDAIMTFFTADCSFDFQEGLIHMDRDLSEKKL